MKKSKNIVEVTVPILLTNAYIPTIYEFQKKSFSLTEIEQQSSLNIVEDYQPIEHQGRKPTALFFSATNAINKLHRLSNAILTMKITKIRFSNIMPTKYKFQ